MTQDVSRGDTVRYAGRDYTVLNITELHYGLVDPTRPPMIDDQNGQQVAHLAIRKTSIKAVAS